MTESSLPPDPTVSPSSAEAERQNSGVEARNAVRAGYRRSGRRIRGAVLALAAFFAFIALTYNLFSGDSPATPSTSTSLRAGTSSEAPTSAPGGTTPPTLTTILATTTTRPSPTVETTSTTAATTPLPTDGPANYSPSAIRPDSIALPIDQQVSRDGGTRLEAVMQFHDDRAPTGRIPDVRFKELQTARFAYIRSLRRGPGSTVIQVLQVARETRDGISVTSTYCQAWEVSDELTIVGGGGVRGIRLSRTDGWPEWNLLILDGVVRCDSAEL
jgi:hypothetical protein